MKKRFLLILCCFLLFLSGCATKYQRIDLESDTLGEELASYISEDTIVMNTIEAVFPTQLPIYQISEREITQQEFQQMIQQLGIADDPSYNHDHFELEGNTVFCNLASYTDFSRGYFDMTDEELETLAWEFFEKIPFMEGNFEYLGIQSRTTVNDSAGDHISRVGVSFRRLLDDIRIVGEDNCTLYFDGSGLVGIQIRLFDYEQIGTMDVITLENAVAQIKSPDAFIIETQDTTHEMDFVETLDVNRINLLWVNQHSEGCSILQPIYNFMGIATDANGEKTAFSSRVIAIPESYTYESD